MIGSFLTRGLVMLFGYAYPAYECYKTVELNKPEIEQLRFWCQYWILVAVLTVGERFCDAFISWVPMYSEAKLAFIIYLWYPKTKGTNYVYDSFFRPYMAKHETEIDRNLLELRTRAGDIAILHWQRAANYVQTRIYEILQYVAAQSTSKHRPTQPQPQGTTIHQHVPPTRPPATTQMESNIPSSSSSIPSSNQQKNASREEVGPSSIPKPALSTASSSIEKAASLSFIKAASSSIEKAASSSIVKAACSSIEKAASSIIEKAASSGIEKAASSSIEKAAVGSETTSQSAPTSRVEPQQTKPVAPTTEENAYPPPKETVMEETIRATRGRLRKNRSIGK